VSNSRLSRLTALTICGTVAWTGSISAQPTSVFTYQGQLKQNASPLSDVVDMKFSLFDSDVAETPLAGPIVFDGLTLAPVQIVGGLFSVELDFGLEALQQGGQWLQVDVRSPHDPKDAAAYTTLSPRQRITAAPFALSVPGLASNESGVEVAGDFHAFGDIAASAYTSNSPLIFKVNPLDEECARFDDANCYLGLGTTAPGARLHVGGVAGVDGIMFPDGTLQTTAAGNIVGGDSVWSRSGANDIYYSQGKVGIGTTAPNHRLRITGGPVWTANSWIGALELENAAAIGWRANNAGQRFGLGHTNTGLAFFRTESDPGTVGSPANYDMFISDAGLVGMGTLAPAAKLSVVRDWDGQQGALELKGDKPTLRLSGGAIAGNESWIMHVGSDGPGNLGFFRRTASPVFPFPYVWNNMMTLSVGGDVGIGTSNPISKLDIAAAGDGAELLRFSTERPWVFRQIRTGPSAGLQLLSTSGLKAFEITATDGNNVATFLADSVTSRVGIGTTAPTNKLDVVGANADAIHGTHVGSALTAGVAGTSLTVNGNGVIGRADIGSNAYGVWGQAANGIGGYFTGGNYALIADGRASVGLLEIAGADVAEKFMSSDENVEPGTVMEIDAEHPGQLRVARGAYSSCVAGVVSGAGDIPVGAVLGNMPGHENAPAIALSGRVWVQCDTSNGAIAAGDLLTTSSTPGHAMKAVDRAQAYGAILGKAMTALSQGKRGLVLVLVSLQ